METAVTVFKNLCNMLNLRGVDKGVVAHFPELSPVNLSTSLLQGEIRTHDLCHYREQMPSTETIELGYLQIGLLLSLMHLTAEVNMGVSPGYF